MLYLKYTAGKWIAAQLNVMAVTLFVPLSRELPLCVMLVTLTALSSCQGYLTTLFLKYCSRFPIDGKYYAVTAESAPPLVVLVHTGRRPD